MNDFTIFIYCIIDNLSKKVTAILKSRHKTTDSEFVTTIIIVARNLSSNFVRTHNYMHSVHKTNSPYKSNFICIYHRLKHMVNNLFYGLTNVLKQLNTICVYLVDSFTVEVCKNIRISRYRLYSVKYR